MPDEYDGFTYLINCLAESLKHPSKTAFLEAQAHLSHFKQKGEKPVKSMADSPSSREVILSVVRRRLRQHRYDPNLEEAFRHLPVSINLEGNPIIDAIRAVEGRFTENDRSAVMEAFWTNDCHLVPDHKAKKVFLKTLNLSLKKGLSWRKIVRILVILTVLADQYFKEGKLQRITSIIDWTLRYFSDNHIEAWIQAGEGAWYDLVTCAFGCPEPEQPEPVDDQQDQWQDEPDVAQAVQDDLTKLNAEGIKDMGDKIASIHETQACTDNVPEVAAVPIADQDPDTTKVQDNKDLVEKLNKKAAKFKKPQLDNNVLDAIKTESSPEAIFRSMNGMRDQANSNCETTDSSSKKSSPKRPQSDKTLRKSLGASSSSPHSGPSSSRSKSKNLSSKSKSRQRNSISKASPNMEHHGQSSPHSNGRTTDYYATAEDRDDDSPTSIPITVQSPSNKSAHQHVTLNDDQDGDDGNDNERDGSQGQGEDE